MSNCKSMLESQLDKVSPLTRISHQEGSVWPGQARQGPTLVDFVHLMNESDELSSVQEPVSNSTELAATWSFFVVRRSLSAFL